MSSLEILVIQKEIILAMLLSNPELVSKILNEKEKIQCSEWKDVDPREITEEQCRKCNACGKWDN